MASRTDIVTSLARERRVETMIENIAHQSLTADLQDLSQMVYMILLSYDERKLQDLWEHRQMDFFLARIIVNQFRSSNSPFHALFRRHQSRQDNIDNYDFADEK